MCFQNVPFIFLCSVYLCEESGVYYAHTYPHLTLFMLCYYKQNFSKVCQQIINHHNQLQNNVARYNDNYLRAHNDCI